MTVRFVKLNKDAKIPVYSSAAAAGADLCSLPGDDITILPGETVMIHTGLSMEIPEEIQAALAEKDIEFTKKEKDKLEK